MANPARFLSIRTSLFLTLSLGLLVAAFPFTAKKAAAATLVQTTMTTQKNSSSVAVGFSSAPAANDLLVAICSAASTVTLTAPTGFSTAINQSQSASQAIFYKIATGTEGTGAFTCSSSSSTKMALQIYEYSGINPTTPLDSTPGYSTGTSATASSGSITTSDATDLLLAGVTVLSSSSSPSGWTSSFVQENSATDGAGNPKAAYGGADYNTTASGTYSTTASVGNAFWIGEIVAFNSPPQALSLDMVNSSGQSVASPTVAMSSANLSFACQTATGTLGTASQQIQLANTTTTAAWTISIAATNGTTATWTSGSNTYAYNNSATSGCSSGQLTVNPATGTITPQSGCSNTGLSLGSSSAFNGSTTSSITLASASTSAAVYCTWDITGIGLSQAIPANQASGSYSIGMTLTVVAN